MVDKFNVRVYGTWIQGGKVLLTHELFRGIEMIKFPGGGVQHGEGIADALRREFNEELRVEVDIVRHLYTTDFFQQSAFNPSEQLISIYYEVKSTQLPQLPESGLSGGGPFKIIWEDLNGINPQLLTFPIDQHVIQLLKAGY